jgi:Family of unknown function (DUF5985)
MNRGEAFSALVAGAIVMGYAVCALFFLRFWRRTGDRLFVVFSLAFWLFALQRLALVLTEPVAETRTGLYLVRLFGFLLILGAIIDKNRSTGDSAGM